MKRLYFISDDLDDLDNIEAELENTGINKPQIHVLSENDAGVDAHKHLHNIQAVLKQEVVHGTVIGSMLGFLAAMLVIAIAYLTRLPEIFTWMPFYFLSIVMFGFVTWSGGFYGIQKPHKDFQRFQKELNNGKHIIIVDIEPSQENIIKQVELNHPQLVYAGSGPATPRWIIMAQQHFKEITTTTFP